MKQSHDIQNPKNHGNDHDRIQYRLDRGLHRDEAVHQPQQDPDYDENFHKLDERHVVDPSGLATGHLDPPEGLLRLNFRESLRVQDCPAAGLGGIAHG